LFTAATVITTRNQPVNADVVLGNFVGVARSWSAVMRDLKANELLGK
jgi:hypothetical protein